MRTVVIDDAIAAPQAFASFGEVVACRGADITRELLLDTDAEALVTRSVTRVDEDLVAGTRLCFVGSATAGVDHVDPEALHRHGIDFAHAPGCNAPAVVDWVLEAMRVAGREDPTWIRGSVGIVGCGEVGGRLAAALRSEGREVLLCDPPRADRGDDDHEYLGLEELVSRVEVLSLHVPLHAQAAYPTYHLVDRPLELRLINTSRGGVVATSALEHWSTAGAIIDVWEGEPELPWALLEGGPHAGPVRLASPHVAGYSIAAKLRATEMICERLRSFLIHGGGISPSHPRWSPEGILASTEHQPFDLEGDDRRLRALVGRPAAERARAFEAMRRGYPLRHPVHPIHPIRDPPMEQKRRP